MNNLEAVLLNLPDVDNLKKIISIPSKYHTHNTVYEHMIECMNKAKEMYPLSKTMLICAALHDIGKVSTYAENNGLITFPQHAEVSQRMASPILCSLCVNNFLSEKEALEALFIIGNHMRPAGCPLTHSSVRKLLIKLGLNLNSVLAFSDINLKSCNPAKTINSCCCDKIRQLKDAIKTFNLG